MSGESRHGEGYTTESIRRLFVVSASFADLSRPHLGSLDPPDVVAQRYQNLCEEAKRYDRSAEGSIFDRIAKGAYATLTGETPSPDGIARPPTELFAELGIGVGMLADLGTSPQLRPASANPFEASWLANLTTAAVQKVDYARFRLSRRYWSDYIRRQEPSGNLQSDDILGEYDRYLGIDRSQVRTLPRSPTPVASLVELSAGLEAHVRTLVDDAHGIASRATFDASQFVSTEALVRVPGLGLADDVERLGQFKTDYLATLSATQLGALVQGHPEVAGIDLSVPFLSTILNVVDLVHSATEFLMQEIATQIVVEFVGEILFETVLGIIFPCFGFLLTFGRLLAFLFGA